MSHTVSAHSQTDLARLARGVWIAIRICQALLAIEKTEMGGCIISNGCGQISEDSTCQSDKKGGSSWGQREFAPTAGAILLPRPPPPHPRRCRHQPGRAPPEPAPGLPPPPMPAARSRHNAATVTALSLPPMPAARSVGWSRCRIGRGWCRWSVKGDLSRMEIILEQIPLHDRVPRQLVTPTPNKRTGSSSLVRERSNRSAAAFQMRFVRLVASSNVVERVTVRKSDERILTSIVRAQMSS